jgi:type IV secretory pathway VirJ component
VRKGHSILYALALLFCTVHFARPADAPPPGAFSDLKGLPVIEVPSSASSRDDFAIVLSGDGGWAGLDRKIAELLSVERGVSAVGFNSLAYFLSRRTPDEAARDVERIMRHYIVAWAKSKVILVGYSFGADVLPFVASRLPADLRAAVEVLVFISLGSSIDFKFGLSDWFGGKPKPTEMATVPEVKKLGDMKIVCVYGLDDKDKPCASAELDFVTAIPLQGGHGIHGDAVDVVAAIMKSVE